MTERTAAETERPGEGKTPAEIGQQAFRAAIERGEPLAHAWQFAATAIQATIIPCTFPSCLSAQTAAKAGEEIARLNAALGKLAPKGTWLCEVLENIWRAESKDKSNAIAESARDTIFEHGLWEGPRPKDEIARLTAELKQSHADIAALKAELSNLIAATKGQTFYHSDEAVNAEMGRLRGELAASEKCCSDCEEKQMGVNADTYQRGVEDERERCAQLLLGQGYQFEPIGIGALRIKWANAIRSSSPSPQKNTSECQEVCEWTLHRDQYSDMFHTSCGRAWDKGQDDVEFCPFCGKRVKV